MIVLMMPKLSLAPLPIGASLPLGDRPLFENPTCPVRYRQMVGALEYVTLSRPVITYAINKVCQFIHSQTDNHWSVVKWILLYLKGTSNFGLRLTPSCDNTKHAYGDAKSSLVTVYSDVDWLSWLSRWPSIHQEICYKSWFQLSFLVNNKVEDLSLGHLGHLWGWIQSSRW